MDATGDKGLVPTEPDHKIEERRRSQQATTCWGTTADRFHRGARIDDCSRAAPSALVHTNQYRVGPVAKSSRAGARH